MWLLYKHKQISKAKHRIYFDLSSKTVGKIINFYAFLNVRKNNQRRWCYQK
ncbi:MAG: hypothetical protein ACI4PS_03930 [Rhodocyclaceae bacterium]